MADEQSHYFDQGAQYPRSLPQFNIAWSNNDRHSSGGEDMKFTYSDESYRGSEFSGAAPTPGTSPNTAMSAYGTPPEYHTSYDSHYTTTPTYPHKSFNGYDSHDHAQNSLIKPEFGSHESQERDTPSTLGWTPDTDLMKLYKFVTGKGKEEPYFRLLPKWTVTYQTPEKVYLDSPSNPEKGAYQCAFPGTCKRIFGRPADLDRHYENVHVPLEERRRFECDYKNCTRKTEPFGRKDHYRDHLRDYHKEDLGKAKDNKKISRSEWKKLQEQWLKDRKIFDSWWRCTKCLIRNYVEKDGWECQSCKVPCEPERKEARLQKFQEEAYQYGATCSTCTGGGYIYDDAQRNWVQCGNCLQPAATSEPSYYTNDSYVDPSYLCSTN